MSKPLGCLGVSKSFQCVVWCWLLRLLTVLVSTRFCDFWVIVLIVLVGAFLRHLLGMIFFVKGRVVRKHQTNYLFVTMNSSKRRQLRSRLFAEGKLAE